MAHPLTDRIADAVSLAWNESVRWWCSLGGRVLASLLEWQFQASLSRYRIDQEALAVRLGIGADVPVKGYDAATRARMEAQGEGVLAETSGSTRDPKRIAWSPDRVRRIKRANASAICRMSRAYGLKRAGLLILASLKDDTSLTRFILAAGKDPPPRLMTLLTPALLLQSSALAPTVEAHGATAARLWLLALTNPGMLYATNPSTLAVFLEEVDQHWEESTSLIRAHATGNLDPNAARAARRVLATGWRERLQRIAHSTDPLALSEIAPSLRIYTCWDGGYVAPFLDRLHRHLPKNRFQLVPMYSMSTEAIETVHHFQHGLAFLPAYPGTLYEFFEGDAPDKLLLPWELSPNGLYTMVISDSVGLVRYDTQDVFRCHRFVDGLPDLRFVRRRGLAFSFTGEKLTGEQLELAWDACCRRHDLRELQFTVLPSRPPAVEGLFPNPGYVLIVATTKKPPPTMDLEALALDFDRSLLTLNAEYKAKRASDRLNGFRAVQLPYETVARALDPQTVETSDVDQRAWESQFKLLPLAKMLWESTGLEISPDTIQAR